MGTVLGSAGVADNSPASFHPSLNPSISKTNM